MTKLITGGLGFIGTNLARALLQKGEEVVLFDVVRSSPLIHDIKDKLKIVQGDLSSWAEVLEVVKQFKIDGIYHTGALLSASAEEKPITAYQVNAGEPSTSLKRQDCLTSNGSCIQARSLLTARASISLMKTPFRCPFRCTVSPKSSPNG